MARRQTPIDAEQRALHDSWRKIARVVLLVGVTATSVWALCSVLRIAVHASIDGLLAFASDRSRWWAPAALMGALLASGLIRGWLNRREAWRPASSDGMDVALSNYHCTYANGGESPEPRYNRSSFRLSLRKAIATWLTLASGASGGLEGPVVLIGESTGAGFARLLRVKSVHELRTYQLAGISAAVSTLLGAPFSAALFAIEVAYGTRIAYHKLAYALFAAVLPYTLNNHLFGFRPLFTAPPHAPVYAFSEYGLTALAAVTISAPVALLFGLAMKHTRRIVERASPVLRGALGATLTGLIAVSLFWGLSMDFHHVLGMGERTVAELLAPTRNPRLDLWWFLLLIVLARLLATGFTLQSGGSAGMLIPSMVVGGVSGAAMAQLIKTLGLASTLDTRLFVVVGIASSLVAMIGVPLAAIAMVLEVFGSAYGPPSVLACGLTYVLTLRMDVYGEERMRKQMDSVDAAGNPPPA
jgi:CIC family chloride channel protein